MEQVDVLIVGAGLSGIGIAARLSMDLPGLEYTVLESRAASGGTWDLFRYPGIRSDSDVISYGFAFKPWRSDAVLASGEEILDYLREAAAEHGVEARIRYQHRVVRADWSSSSARWSVEVERADAATGNLERVRFEARWLVGATGYYRYDHGYTPDIPGLGEFAGDLVHPQQWPADLDWAGRSVVVIGSGATAVTLIPALAESAGHVTMLQRTPTYILALPGRDRLRPRLEHVLGEDRAYRLGRRRSIMQQGAIYRLAQRYPRQARALVRRATARALPKGYDVDTDFNPPYGVWDQRLCVDLDGAFFAAIRAGRASVVTGTIELVVPEGVLLTSGALVRADVLVTATGLELQVFGGIELAVDGKTVEPAGHLAYRGAMLSDVPNFAFAIGYTNASWTLKVDLVAEYLARVVAEQRRVGADIAVPVLGALPAQTRPLLDFGAGYVQRALDQLPRAGAERPWGLPMDYRDDVRQLREEPLNDGVLAFRRVHARV